MRSGWRGSGPASTVRGTSGDSVTRWIDIGYPEDRDRAEKRLDDLESGSDTDEETKSVEADEATVDS